ncbi:GntR family transcriptional regulator [Prauserella halophila]|nr:GntR family transcriptional regulator [Prauserella halophila]
MATQEIRRRVFAGEMLPGTKVDQDSIAEDLGISKLPLREALITLEYEGLIENVPRRGAFVARITRNDIHDQYRVFGLVSGLAAERAATNISERELGILNDLADRMESGADREEQEQLNSEFHRRINHASESRRLLSMLGTLVKTLPQGFYEAHDEWPDKAHQDHRQIVKALTARSGSKARAAIEKHFADGADRAVALLEQQGFWDH